MRRDNKKDRIIDKEIETMLADLATLNQDTEEYGIMVENLRKLNEAKAIMSSKKAEKIMSAKRQLQFSQRIVWFTFLFSITIVLLVFGFHVLFKFLEIDGLSEEFTTTVTIYGGITSGLSFTAYAVLQGWRDNSVNKHCKGKRDAEDMEAKG